MIAYLPRALQTNKLETIARFFAIVRVFLRIVSSRACLCCGGVVSRGCVIFSRGTRLYVVDRNRPQRIMKKRGVSGKYRK